MKNHIAEGLDAGALEKLNAHVRHTTERCTNGRGMLEYAAVQDFNPMIAKAFAMRYACRQRGCGLVPKSEAGWIIATQISVAKEYWFCGACGGEFRYGLGGRRPRLERPG